MTEYFKIMWEGDNNLHSGYWHDQEDDISIVEAQERFTDYIISKLDLQPGQTLLDIGCGTGWPAIRLAHAKNCDVVGINISQTQLDIANARAQSENIQKNVHFTYADAQMLPYAAASFDAAWAIESMYHMTSHSQVLNEIARVLRKGGILLLADAVTSAPLTVEQKQLIQMYQANTVSTANELKDAITCAHLEVVEYIDLTKETRKTLDKTIEMFERKQHRLSQIYGPGFVAIMKHCWPQIVDLHQKLLGYAVILARKPDR
jgi:cyclopropane fatty-acyl-phospholipid synthase-like methyltransferase